MIISTKRFAKVTDLLNICSLFFMTTLGGTCHLMSWCWETSPTTAPVGTQVKCDDVRLEQQLLDHGVEILDVRKCS